jgi:Leucine-rich repeat (LRR) protein
MGSLPSELGLMTDLTSLSLEQNTIITGTIPNTLQKLTHLKSFLCLYCSLTGEIPNWIGSSWSDLRVLGLTQNTIFGSIPSSMEKLTKLVVLGLDDNLLTGTLDTLQSLPLLEQAYLENNYFDGNITDTFFRLSSGLKTLDASGNHLGGQVPIHLLSHLQILDLNDNQLTVFADAIPDDNSLSLLALQKNPLRGTIPDTLRHLKALTHLDLSSTGLEGKMPDLGEMTDLNHLFLANSNFDAGSIPKSYGNLIKLVDLSLKASSRTGHVPSWLDKLDELKLLDLHQNNLTGTIPPSLGNMTRLEFLLLNRNQLTGTIPSELALANSLQIIFIDGNSLSGTMDPICFDATYLMASAADCGSISNSTEEVTCSCCNICCVDSDETCNNRNYLSEFDPQWEDGYKRRFYDFDSKGT